MFEALTLAALKGKLRALVRSKAFWAVLLVIAIAAGTAVTLDHWKNSAVSTATTSANQAATVAAYKTKDSVDTRTAAIDQRFDRKREQTIKDYANARSHLENATPADRDAPAPRLLIDTLNELDRMRGARDAVPVPDASTAG